MADRTPDTNQLRAWSDTAMGYALSQELEPAAYSTTHAIDALRLELRATATALTATLDDRAALAGGSRRAFVVDVVDVVEDDEDDVDDVPVGHRGGYFCGRHDFQVSCDHPDYELLVEAHESLHAAVRDVGSSDRTSAMTEVLQSAATAQWALWIDGDPAGQELLDALLRMVRAAAHVEGAAEVMRAVLHDDTEVAP